MRTLREIRILRHLNGHGVGVRVRVDLLAGRDGREVGGVDALAAIGGEVGEEDVVDPSQLVLEGQAELLAVRV